MTILASQPDLKTSDFAIPIFLLLRRSLPQPSGEFPLSDVPAPRAVLQEPDKRRNVLGSQGRTFVRGSGEPGHTLSFDPVVCARTNFPGGLFLYDSGTQEPVHSPGSVCMSAHRPRPLDFAFLSFMPLLRQERVQIAHRMPEMGFGGHYFFVIAVAHAGYSYPVFPAALADFSSH